MLPGAVSRLKRCVFSRTNRFLDIACGTGDLSINACLKHRHITAFGVDFILPMVKEATNKAEKEGLSGQNKFYSGKCTESAVWGKCF